MSGKRKLLPDLAHTTHTNEPVNLEALSSLACRVASGKVCWPGSDITIRRLLHSFLAQVDSKGFLPVTWYEKQKNIKNKNLKSKNRKNKKYKKHKKTNEQHNTTNNKQQQHK